MTKPPDGPDVLHLADSGEAADLTAFLSRLLHYDKAAAVRLQAHGQTLAVFGHPPFDVLAIRTARLASGAEPVEPALDATVSAGQFLEGFDDAAATATVPPTVTGPPWAGLLPPRGGWRRTAELPLEAVRREVAVGIAEFRARSEELAPEGRTRPELDRIAADIWSRPLRLGEVEEGGRTGTSGTGLPLRAVHAAHALGFLRPARVPGGPGGTDAGGTGDGIVVFASGGWLRVRTAYGSIAVRRTTGLGLSVTPLP